jgi:hypothetical protein
LKKSNLRELADLQEITGAFKFLFGSGGLLRLVAKVIDAGDNGISSTFLTSKSCFKYEF